MEPFTLLRSGCNLTLYTFFSVINYRYFWYSGFEDESARTRTRDLLITIKSFTQIDLHTLIIPFCIRNLFYVEEFRKGN